MKLNQILAIEKGVKTRALRELTELHRSSQLEALYEGRERRYQPLDEEGEQLPRESQRIQQRSEEVFRKLQECTRELFDVTYMKDRTNCTAKADVVVEGTTLLRDVPVTYLLFLEKQLNDLHTFVLKTPTLDPNEQWSWNNATSAFATEPVATTRTKKLVKPVVLYEATKDHPAQVKEVTEDCVVGHWSQIRYSAAMTQQRKDQLLGRIVELSKAVKIAREEANQAEVVALPATGSTLFEYLFSK
jgi:hypothetical protein